MQSRALFLDRDGIINEDRQFVGFQKDFVFKEGIFPFLRAVQNKGYRLVIVTNQSGVARGYYSVKDYEALTRWMLQELKKQGITIDLTLACFAYEGGSFWRKPNPGMILEGAMQLNLDLARSAMVGDNVTDVQAAGAAHIGKAFLLTENPDLSPPDTHIIKTLNEILPHL
ncbi:MAG: HAD family hydrolase [Alphaproteobacteria bacterium]|nr:HAD family hydrolase [Alphaproteobacteria bacterium]